MPPPELAADAPRLDVPHPVEVGLLPVLRDELGLALLINLRMLTPFKDIDMAAPMLLKGKLKPFPHMSKGAKELRQVMERIKLIEKGQRSVPQSGT